MKRLLAAVLAGSALTLATAAWAQPAGQDSLAARDAPASNSTASNAATAPSSTDANSPSLSGGVVGAISIPPPPDGKGQVVFFRKNSFEGMAVWFNVRENNKLLGKLSNGAYFVQAADPGTHTYTAATENKDTLKLEVDPGETYYVEGTVTMGFFIGEANISPSDEASFNKASPKLKLAAAPPPDNSSPPAAAASDAASNAAASNATH